VPLCLLALAAPSRGDDTSALINKALDEQVKLTLNNVLPAAIEVITKQTGVPIQVDPVVYEAASLG